MQTEWKSVTDGTTSQPTKGQGIEMFTHLKISYRYGISNWYWGPVSQKDTFYEIHKSPNILGFCRRGKLGCQKGLQGTRSSH